MRCSVLKIATYLSTVALVGKGRYLAIYPECAVIKDQADREVCCDSKVVSEAGR